MDGIDKLANQFIKILNVDTIRRNRRRMLKEKSIKRYLQEENPILYQGSSVTSYLQSKENQAVSVSNNLPIINFDRCEQILKNNSLIGQDEQLYSINYSLDAELLLNSDLDKANNLTARLNETSYISNTISTILVDSSGEVVNTTLCDNFLLSFPIANNIIDVTRQNAIKKELKYDIFNQEDEAFNDICTKFPSANQTDFTISYRRKTFNTTSGCTNGCEYSTVDNNNYSTCSCTKVTKNAASKFANSLFSGIDTGNVKLFGCYNLIPKSEVKNYGWWTFGGFTVLAILLLIFSLFYISYERHLEEIKKNDLETGTLEEFLWKVQFKQYQKIFSNQNETENVKAEFIKKENLEIQLKRNASEFIDKDNVIFKVSNGMMGSSEMNKNSRKIHLSNVNDFMALQNKRGKNLSMESFKGILQLNTEEKNHSIHNYESEISKTAKQSDYNDVQSFDFGDFSDKNPHSGKIVEIITINEFDQRYNSYNKLMCNSETKNIKDSEKISKSIIDDLINNAVNISSEKENEKCVETDRNIELKKIEDIRNNIMLGVINSEDETERGELHYLKSLLRTDADLNLLPIRIRLKLDEDNFFVYIFNDFIQNQDFIGIFVGKSIFDPFYLRVLKLLFNLSIMFGLNAYFFTEDSIDSQTEAKIENGGDSVGFEYVLVNQIMNYMWPIIITNILLFATNIILRIPKEFKMSLFEKLKNSDMEVQLAGL